MMKNAAGIRPDQDTPTETSASRYMEEDKRSESESHSVRSHSTSPTGAIIEELKESMYKNRV